MWCGPVGALSPTAACRGPSTKVSNCLTARAGQLVAADAVVAAIMAVEAGIRTWRGKVCDLRPSGEPNAEIGAKG